MAEKFDRYSYSIEHIRKNDDFCFLVTLLFDSGNKERSEFKLPESFGPLEGFEKCISINEVNGSEVSWSNNGSKLIIEHPKFQSIQVLYEISNFPLSDQMEGYQRIMSLFYPRIFEKDFLALGSSVFLYPEVDQPITVTIDFRPMLRFGDHIYSSFGKGNFFKLICNRSGELQDSLFLSTTTNNYEHITDKNGHVVFYIQKGNAQIGNEIIKENTAQIISGLREFWGEKNAPPFLVHLGFETLATNNKGTLSYHLGSALQNALTIYASPYISLLDFQKLLYHEMMHCWIGVKLRATDKEEEDFDYLWFTEGFTEYFAYKAMLRDGLLTSDEYQNIINEDFLSWIQQSPFKNISNQELGERFTTDESLMQLPYKRGFAFALFIDLKIKHANKHQLGLIDLVKEISHYYEENGLTIDEDFSFFSKTCSDFIREDFNELYNTHIENGESIDFSSLNVLPYLHFSDDPEMVEISDSPDDIQLLMI